MSLIKTLTVSAVAMVASAQVYAAPYTVSNSLTGDFLISGFADATPGSFSIQATNLVGDLNLYVPNSGYTTIDVSGNAILDWGGPAPINVGSSTFVNLFAGLLNISGATPGLYSFNFDSTSTYSGSGGFSFDYDGNTTNAIVGALAAATGLPLANPNGAGTLTFTYQLTGDGFDIDVVDTPSNWVGFGGLLFALDSLSTSQTDGKIDGSFALRNVQANVTEVPEPASLALLGIGLAGLGAVRRRKQAA